MTASLLAIVAAADAPRFFADVAALLVAGAVISYLCFRLGLVPIVGFLLAGALIGPNALGLVRDRALVDAAAEVGVILLLFTIGIEFSLEALGRIRRLIFAGGGLQVALTCLAAVALLAAFGVDWRSGLYTGFLIALSSTAIVLKLLASRGEMEGSHGQVALGLLIFQDLAIVAMVLVVPMMAGAGGSAAGVIRALGTAALLIAATLLVARRLMPPVLEAVARTCSPELFLLTVIAICFGTAYLTSLAGVSLSLGAFLAGLVVSESAFSEHALSEILPLQILFSATFFISVGMLLDVRFLIAHLPLVLAGIGAVIVIKVATTMASVRLLGYPLSVAAASGLALAQVGEFSFVLERTGRDVGLSPAGLAGTGSQAFIAATVLLMVATPVLSSLGTRIAARMERAREQRDARVMEADEERGPSYEHLENHVVVAGYGEAARRMVRALHGVRIPFVITTLSPAGAQEAEAHDLPVLRGDASRRRTLLLAGAERAKMLVIADDNPAMAERIAAVARTVNPTMRIVVRTRYESEVRPLTAAGTDRVITEEMESIVQVFAEVLRSYEIAPTEIEAREEDIRRGDYHVLRTDEAPALAPCVLDENCLERRSVTIRVGMPVAGRSLAELDLGARFGIIVEDVQRDGSSGTTSPDTVLAPGDALRLRGDAGAFAASAPLFRAAGEMLPASRPAARSTARTAIDPEQTIELIANPAAGCTHADRIRAVRPATVGCEECLRDGTTWVHLRICMSCGHVGCCDSSPRRHATQHFRESTHPIMRSLEPDERWGWCYVDGVML